MNCAVIGSPVTHSRSPDLHRAAYKELGLDWEFTRCEVRADEVASFVAGLDSTWRGLSVTMPCKQAILPLGIPDPVVKALGVGNTVIFDGRPNDPTTTRLYNTDVSGIHMILGSIDLNSRIQVFGNGATARSSVYSLSRLGVNRVQVRARDQVKTELLVQDAARWGIDVIPADQTPDVVVSTVPAGIAAEWGAEVRPSVVFDVLYDPWPTPLATMARSRGAQVFTGLDLLAAQASRQIELMTGASVDISVLKGTVEGARPLEKNQQ